MRSGLYVITLSVIQVSNPNLDPFAI